MQIFKKTVARDLVISLNFLIIITGFVSFLAFYIYSSNTLHKQFLLDTETRTTNIASILEDPIFNMFEEEVQRIIILFADSPDVIKVTFRAKYFLEYTYINPLHEHNSLINNSHKIERHIETQRKSTNIDLGTIEVIYTKQIIQNTIRNSIVLGFTIIGCIIVIISVSTIFLLNSV